MGAVLRRGLEQVHLESHAAAAHRVKEKRERAEKGVVLWHIPVILATQEAGASSRPTWQLNEILSQNADFKGGCVRPGPS